MDNIKGIYDLIISICNEEERKKINFLFYSNGDFIHCNENYGNTTELCLNVKIIQTRLDYFLNFIKNEDITFNIVSQSKYYAIIKLFNKNNNFIVFDYVVNSHVVIPKSILKHFAKKTFFG